MARFRACFSTLSCSALLSRNSLESLRLHLSVLKVGIPIINSSHLPIYIVIQRSRGKSRIGSSIDWVRSSDLQRDWWIHTFNCGVNVDTSDNWAVHYWCMGVGSLMSSHSDTWPIGRGLGCWWYAGSSGGSQCFTDLDSAHYSLIVAIPHKFHCLYYLWYCALSHHYFCTAAKSAGEKFFFFWWAWLGIMVIGSDSMSSMDLKYKLHSFYVYTWPDDERYTQKQQLEPGKPKHKKNHN